MKFDRKFLYVIIILLFSIKSKANDREVWIDYLRKISYPILKNTASDSLKLFMPVYAESTKDFQYLEALGRTICGIAPWLELGNDLTEEGELRNTFRKYALKAIYNAVTPSAKDYMNFSNGSQPLVDASYLAHGLLRAPKELWGRLDFLTQERIITELKKTRKIKPGNNNWLLFASMIEAFLLEYEGSCDNARLVEGVEKFLFQFYHGDGMYGDGNNFAMDYYNSYVIHPMLTDVINIGFKHDLKNFRFYKEVQMPRLQRYAEIQERMISPEGTYPVVGRTLVCRNGAFQALAQASLLQVLPSSLSPGQVRSAMTAILTKQYANESLFDENGFLSIGFAGKQESIAETYVSSGSPYHCLTFFLPLGLSSSEPFWLEPYQKWTSLKAFDGENILKDHSLDDSKDRLLAVQYIWHFYIPFKYKLLMFIVGFIVIISSIWGVISIIGIIKKSINVSKRSL